MPAEIVKDDDVDAVTPLNRLYYVATQWRKTLDNLKRGDIGKQRMMAESDRYHRAPNFGSYDRRMAYAHLRKLAREAIQLVDGCSTRTARAHPSPEGGRPWAAGLAVLLCWLQ